MAYELVYYIFIVNLLEIIIVFPLNKYKKSEKNWKNPGKNWKKI